MTAPFATLLEIRGRRTDDVLPILSKNETDKGLHIDWTTVAEAPPLVESYAGQRHVWFGVQPTNRPSDPRSRGTAREVTSIITLYADLDYKHDHKPTGMEKTEVLALIDDISDAVGTPPSALVASGYGIQPYWPIEPVGQIDGIHLLFRWRALLIKIANLRGVEIDTGVYDAPRILRVPGPPNIKYGDVKPTGLVTPYVGRRLSMADLDLVFAAHLSTNELEYSGATFDPSLVHDGPDRIFTRQQALDFMENEALSVIRNTPWGAGSNFWKVLWERSLVMSNFVGMWPEVELKDMIKQAILDC